VLLTVSETLAIALSGPAYDRSRALYECAMIDVLYSALLKIITSPPQVEDQMKLLQNCWSELLILDFVFKQMSHNKLDQLRMVSRGQ
jgi:hypothetical protein